MGPFVNADWLGAHRGRWASSGGQRDQSQICPDGLLIFLERQFSHRLKIIVDDDHFAAVSNTFANIQRRNISPARTASFTASPILASSIPCRSGMVA